MAEVALIAGLASAAGSVFQGYAKKREGEAANDIARYNAGVQRQEGDAALAASKYQVAQLERAANEERVAGQIAGEEKRADLRRVLSTQRAIAAASGAGGVETPGVLDVMGDTLQRGEYLAGLEEAGGETRARGRLNEAHAAAASGEAARARAYAAAYGLEMEGAARKKAGKNAMIGSILEGGGKALTAGYGYFGGGATGGYDPSWKNTTVTRYR